MLVVGLYSTVQEAELSVVTHCVLGGTVLHHFGSQFQLFNFDLPNVFVSTSGNRKDVAPFWFPILIV